MVSFFSNASPDKKLVRTEYLNTSPWKKFSVIPRILECVLEKRDEEKRCIHLDLSTQSGIPQIPDDDQDGIKNVITGIESYVNAYSNYKIDLDLSGHRLCSAKSMQAICELVKSQTSIRSLNISNNNFSGFVAFCFLSELFLVKTGLKEINISGIHPSIGMYILGGLDQSSSLEKINGYDVKTTDFKQVGFMVHKDEWKRKFLKDFFERKNQTVTLDLSASLSKYHDLSEIAEWVKNWSYAHRDFKIEINASKNALMEKDVKILVELVKSEDLRITGLDVSDNALDMASCKIIRDLLLSETKLEKIAFAETNLYVKDYLESAVETNKNKKKSDLKFVNGYDLSKIPLSGINYWEKEDGGLSEIKLRPVKLEKKDSGLNDTKLRPVKLEKKNGGLNEIRLNPFKK